MRLIQFKFRCDTFIRVKVIKEMPGKVASGTPCSAQTVAGRNRSLTLNVRLEPIRGDELAASLVQQLAGVIRLPEVEGEALLGLLAH